MGWLGVIMAFISFFLLIGIWGHSKDTAETLERIEDLLLELRAERPNKKTEP